MSTYMKGAEKLSFSYYTVSVHLYLQVNRYTGDLCTVNKADINTTD